MLQSNPSLADVPDSSPAQLESLARSVEQKKQRLEADIRDYIRRKQEQLRNYERELLEQQRSMDRAGSRAEPDVQAEDRGAQSADAQTPPSNPTESSSSPAETAADLKKLGPGDTAKRTKHTRVHKREKELCGLVTPIFLPLLDAGEATPVKQKKERKKRREEKAEGAATSSPQSEQGSPSRDAEKGKEARRSRSRNSEEKMEQAEAAAVSSEAKSERRKEEAEKEKKRSKRSTIKKSSLRHNGAPRARRKRVSLVIDDQIVLPADAVVDIGTVTSPSETATSSASNSTTSLDDLVDPRLVERVDTPVHHDALHHSLSLNMTLPSTSPTKHTGHTLSDSPSLEFEHQAGSRNATANYSPPKSAGRTFLDPAPSTSMNIPQYASPAPIYSNALEQEEIPEEEYSSEDRENGNFDTYVGGIDGSGVDDVDQAGSYGYPSSLGASYMESYMKARPLSVRIAAAEKAELEDKEKQALLADEKAEQDEFDFDIRKGRVEEVDDDDMDVIGSMEGF
ncbi:hypothetical protein BDV96DRAFT_152710 [Lophiotrema nucula]|uniref:Tymo-45kd-70kd multi-domain protein n=1 Tax=Lophiotrema nucula TaxID=690887 RepID=A0A6A5Z149_9PLEO|nr:hypothetical protein BDV96DRAFT_152710 [Lophiotrema nucula]